MNKLLENVRNIGYTSAALCVLKGLRAKIELGRKQANRLSKHFPSLKGVILTGRAGTGKTYVCRQIYTGLKLDAFHKDGVTSAVWIDGAATTVGRREKFKENPHSIIFWNEIACNDVGDVRLMKQMAEGVISYMKHGDLEETKFTGLLIGSTNDFSAKGKVGRDLEALRDRLDIVEIGPPDGYDPALAIEDEAHYLRRKNAKVDWEMVAHALAAHDDEVLTAEERAAIRPFWLTKLRECLDDRVLTRAGYDFVDCFIFMKRLFREHGGLKDPDVFEAAVNLAYESVSLNPVAIAHLGVVQRDIIYSLETAPDKTRSTNEIKEWLLETGRFISKSTMHRNLNQLIERGLIIKRKHGEYSMLRPDAEVAELKDIPFDGVLEDLAGQP